MPGSFKVMQSNTGKKQPGQKPIGVTNLVVPDQHMFSMQELTTYFRSKDISAAEMQTYTRIMHADVVAIDDIMLFPVKK